MEEIWDELDEKWTEEEKSQNFRIAVLCMYPVDRTLSRSTEHTKKVEKNQVPVIFPEMLYRQCTRYTGHTGVYRK